MVPHYYGLFFTPLFENGAPEGKILIHLCYSYVPPVTLSSYILGLPISMCPLQAVNDNDIHNIIMSYLVHNCFKETVESFIACTGMKQPSDYLEDMENRKSM